MMKRKIRLKLFGAAVFLVQILYCGAERNCTSSKTETAIGRNAFSPRMDFNHWKPVGRGDPLQNDPTYDYLPPVLDQVKYWIEPSKRKPDPPLPEDGKKSEILVLGVLSKKQATPQIKADSRRDNFETYHRKNPHQRIAKPTFSLPSLSSSFFPESLLSTLGKFAGLNEKPLTPYTVLMPPPMNRHKHQPSIPLNLQDFQQTTAVPTTNSLTSGGSSVTIQPSQLVYHSSSLSDQSEWNNHHLTSQSSINWHQSSPKPFSPTIRNQIPNFNENLVFNKHLQPPESFIHIEFNPGNYSNSHLIGSDSNYNLNVVTPPSLRKPHKGSITDNSDEIKETYVKIEKPEFYSTGLGSEDFVSVNTAPLIEIYSHLQHPVSQQEMQTIKKMQTLLPPPSSERPIYKEVAHNPILNALIKEKQKPVTKPMFLTHTPTFIVPSSTTTTTTTTIAPTTTTIFYPTEIPETTTEEQTTTTTTTTISPTTTTTESYLKYFKKPEEIHKKPEYFVIQGHSKVKTYGPTKQVHGIMVQETNEILDDDPQYKVRHLHGFKKEQPIERTRQGRSKDLQTLKHVVETGLGSVDFPQEVYKLDEKKDIKEIDLAFGYNVVDPDKVPKEVYRKGIVEKT